MTYCSIFSLVYFGRRANSAAIQPRLRTILRVISRRRFSPHSGKASFRLNSEILRSLGSRAKQIRATPEAMVRARGRGSAPRIFTTVTAAAYWSQSFTEPVFHGVARFWAFWRLADTPSKLFCKCSLCRFKVVCFDTVLQVFILRGLGEH